jgi:5-formyltetrahydrofolate cyclo-ligase
MNKSDLRATLTQQRKSLSPSERSNKSSKICTNVSKFVSLQNVGQIFSFFSYGEEPDLLPLQEHNPQLAFFYPVVKGKGEMTFHQWSCGEALQKNRYGISEPQCGAASGKGTSNTLILVPALAVTREGDRLGYGAGYYDRYLAAHPQVMTMAVVFSQFVVESLPKDKHDQSMKFIATDSNIEACRQN